MTGYGVKIVNDGDLPQDVEWMFVKRKDGSLVLCIAHSSAGCARALSEAWAAYRCITRQEDGAIPLQREALRPRIVI